MRFAALGDMHRAIALFEESLKLSRKMGRPLGRGQGARKSGLRAYASCGDLKKAVNYFEKDLEIAREIGETAGEKVLRFGTRRGPTICWEIGSRAVAAAEAALGIFELIGDSRAGAARAKLEDGRA